MVCNGCSEEKTAEQMSKSGSGKRCKACRNATNKAWLDGDEATRERAYETNRQWRARNTDNRRAYSLRVNYGITVTEYDDMFEQQSGVCAICLESCKTGKRLAVDHDHATGKVRGLLCTRCNVLIAMGRDSEELIYRAMRYLGEYVE